MTAPDPSRTVPRPVADVLADIATATHHIGPLTVELLNTEQGATQAARLRELGQHLGTLSAEILARAAEVDGRAIDTPQ